MTEPTTIPLVIRCGNDLDRYMAAIDRLGRRGAEEFVAALDDLGDQEQLTRDEAAKLVMTVLREIVLEEPSRGEGVDIAGTAFEVTFRHYRTKHEALNGEVQ